MTTFFASRTTIIRQLTRRKLLSVDCRAFSSERDVLHEGVLHRTGDHPYGSRKYHWVRQASSDSEDDDVTLLPGPKGLSLQLVATLCANRNIVFGASVVDKSLVGTTPPATFSTVISPLLQSALTDCSSVGEQPQAVSTLYGLSSYVQKCLNDEITSEYLQRLDSAALQNPADNDSSVVLEAVRAIATGIPRPGHSVVGVGTHKVAAEAWEALAKEFLHSEEHNSSDESRLYQQQSGAQLVSIELLADTSPEYVQSTGGAMARFFFM